MIDKNYFNFRATAFNKITPSIVRRFEPSLCSRYDRASLFAEAEDLFNHCYMKFDENRNSNFAAFFSVSLQNHFNKLYKKSQRETRLEDKYDVIEENENNVIFANEIFEMSKPNLSDIQKEIIYQKYFSGENLSDQEIGENLGVSHQYVNKQRLQGIKIMRSMVA